MLFHRNLKELICNYVGLKENMLIERLKKKGYYITFIIMNLGVLLNAQGFSSFRYLVYFPLILGLFFMFLSSYKPLSIAAERNYLNYAFVLLISTGLLHFYAIDIIGYYQIFFLIVVLFPTIILRAPELNWKFISLIYICGFLIAIAGNIIKIDLSLESFFTSETSATETNQHPFVFGLLTLLFLYKKKYFWFLINLLFVFLSFKRIVFIGLIFTIPFLLLEQHRPNFFRGKRWLFVMGNILSLLLLFMFSNGVFNNTIRSFTGISAGHFTQGRNSLYQIIVEKWQTSDLIAKLFGHGTGQTFHWTFDAIEQAPHNDLLVILGDYGLVVFLIFFILIYRNKILFPIFFTNILFLSDNTLVYVFYLFLLISINQDLISTSKKELVL